MSRRLVVAVSVLLSLASWSAGAASSAVAPRDPVPLTAEFTAPLGTGYVGNISIDPLLGHIWVTQTTTDTISVFDYLGKPVETLSDQSEPWGSVIVGRTLYVAEWAANRIERFDLNTGRDEGPLAGGIVHPRYLAYAAGELWTASEDTWGADLASVDLISGAVNVFSQWDYYTPDLSWSPGTPNALFVGTYDSPGIVDRLDVTDGAPSWVSSSTFGENGAINGLVVSEDGTRVVPASGSPYEFDERDAITLAKDGVVYAEGRAYPTAVATAGDLLATGIDDPYTPADINVYKWGNTTPIFTASPEAFPGDSGNYATVVHHGLALSPDGVVLVAITSPNGTTDYAQTLHIFPLAPCLPSVSPRLVGIGDKESVHLLWSGRNSNGCPALDYAIGYRIGRGPVQAVDAKGLGPWYRLTGLPRHTPVAVCVTAVGTAGLGPPSNCIRTETT